MYVDIGSVSNHLDPLDGGQVGITMLELDEVTVVDSDLMMTIIDSLTFADIDVR